MRVELKELWDVVSSIIKSPLPQFAQVLGDDVLDSDRQARNFGYTLLIVVFVGFGSWAIFAPLESAARGAGTVQVEGDRKPVQHLEGGIVDQILVANGDYVVEGEPLLQLNATQVLAEQSIVRGQLWAKWAAIDRLLSERDNDEVVVFRDKLLLVSDQRAQTAIASEQALFSARRADRLGEVAVLEQRISQLEQQIEGSTAVVDAKSTVAESLRGEISDLAALLEEGYVDKQRIRQLDRSLAQTLGEIADLEAKVSAAEVGAEEARLKILQLTKRFITEVVDELAKSQDELFDLEQRYRVVSDRVSRSTVRAPASGYVMALKPNSVGAVVGSGEQLLEVVPDVEKLVVDVQMSPMDIDRIRVGQEAEVRFAVFKDSYTITGELVRISADSMIDEITGNAYYEAKVELLESDMELLGGYELVPGMPADVLVKTGSRTLLGYITSPLQRMFENSLIED